METAVEITDLGKTKKVTTDCGEYESRAVIVATGAKHRLLGLEGEEELIGNGISFCAVCDGAFYAGKDVAVIGGGNSALQEAILLSESCHAVHIIQNLPTLTGEDKLVKILESKENVDFTYNTVVTKLLGNGELNGIIITNTETGEEDRVLLDGMFVAIGLVPDNDVANGVVGLDKRGYIEADESTEASIPGIFAAGDCRTKKVRQIATRHLRRSICGTCGVQLYRKQLKKPKNALCICCEGHFCICQPIIISENSPSGYISVIPEGSVLSPAS